MTTRRGYTQSRLYQLSKTNRVYHDLRGLMIWAMSPRTRTSSTTIRPALDSLAIPRTILGSPLLTHHHHHHHSSPQRQPHPVPPLTWRTRCSPLLSALTHSGMRPRSTESSLHRIWRPFALTCVRFWPTMQLFSNSSSLSRPSLRSFLLSTSRHRHHHSDLSDHQGSSLHLLLFFYYQLGH